MHRIDSGTAEADTFGSGKDGFTEGSPGATAATETTDDWFNGVQEEIISPIEGLAITLAKGTRDQLFDAIKKMLRVQAVAQIGSPRTNPSNVDLNGVAADGAGIIVAVGDLGSAGPDAYILRGVDDGSFVDFAEVANPSNVDLYGVAYNGSNLWAAVGQLGSGGADAYICTSSDGNAPWTERVTNSNVNLNAVAHDQSGLWCAVGASGSGGADAYCETSPDGITWTERVTPANADLWGVAYGNSKWAAVGVLGGNVYVIESDDAGVTDAWADVSPTDVGTFRDIAYDAALGLWCAVGSDAAGSLIWTSPDLSAWTQRTVPTINASKDLYTITSDGSGIFAATGGVGYTLVSVDGITWYEAIIKDRPAVQPLNGVAWDSFRKQLILVGDANGVDGSLFVSNVSVF
jgi:hypothetical protein